jgi:VCBS repeat-containing protein
VRGLGSLPFAINPNDVDTAQTTTNLIVRRIEQGQGEAAATETDNRTSGSGGGVVPVTGGPEFELEGHFGKTFVESKTGDVVYRLGTSSNGIDPRTTQFISNLGKDQSLFDVFDVVVSASNGTTGEVRTQLVVRITGGVNDAPKIANDAAAAEAQAVPRDGLGNFAGPSSPVVAATPSQGIFVNDTDAELTPTAVQLSRNPLLVENRATGVMTVFQPSHNLNTGDRVVLGGTITDQIFATTRDVGTSNFALRDIDVANTTVGGVEAQTLAGREFTVARVSADTIRLTPVAPLSFGAGDDVTSRFGGDGVTLTAKPMGRAPDSSPLSLVEGGRIESDFRFVVFSTASNTGAPGQGDGVANSQGQPGTGVSAFKSDDTATLGANPVSTIAGNNLIRVTLPAGHGLDIQVGDILKLNGVGGVTGLAGVDFAKGLAVSAITGGGNTITLISPVTATATGTGGGAAGATAAVGGTTVQGIFGEFTYNDDGSFVYVRDTTGSPRVGGALSPADTLLAVDTFAIQKWDDATQRMQDFRVAFKMSDVLPGGTVSPGAGVYTITDVQKRQTVVEVDFTLEDGKQGFNVVAADSAETAATDNTFADGELSVQGKYGTLILNTNNGTYRYVLADSDGDTLALAQGKVVTDEVFNLTVADGNTLDGNSGARTVGSTLTFTVRGVNDAPVAAADAGTANEDATSSIDAVANDTEVDTGDVKTLQSLGTVVYNANGTTIAVADPSSLFSINANQLAFTPGASLHGLRVGQSVQFTVPYTVRDNLNATSTANVTVTVEGRNDAPTLDDITAPLAVAEEVDASAQDLAAINGQLQVQDLDVGDSISASAAGSNTLSLNGGVAPATVPIGSLNPLTALSALKFTTDAAAPGTGPLLTTGAGQIIGYTYDPAAVNLNFLRRTDSLAVTYAVRITDTDGTAVSANKNLVITINGSNDVPVLADIVSPGAVSELAAASAQVVSVNGVLPFVDLDHGDTVSGLSAGAATIEALGSPLPGGVNVVALTSADALTFGAAQTSNGTNQQITYQYTAAATNLDFLKAGDSLRITYPVKVNDGAGGADSGTKNIVITITGTNDVPVLNVIDAPTAVSEDADAAAQNLAPITGSLPLQDLDFGNTLTASVVGVPVVQMNGGALPGGVDVAALSAVGALTLGVPVISNGAAQTIGYTYDPAAANLDFLRATDVLTIRYTIKVSDGTSDSANRDIVITINGTNDGPEAVADASDATESGVQDFTVLVNDTDKDIGDTKTLDSLGTVVFNANGTGLVLADPSSLFSISGGQVRFTPGATFAPLTAGQEVILTVPYTVRDGANATSTANLVITLKGGNSAPTAVADAAPAATENGVQDFDVLANDTDPDVGDTKTLDSLGAVVFNANGTGLADPGNIFSIVAGQVRMSPGTALDALQVGQSVSFTVPYTMKDAANVTSTADLVVTVNGANDAPTAVADAAPAATENGVQNFDVLANDTDPDAGDTKTIDSLGAVVFGANGTGLADPGNIFSIVAGQIQMNPGTALDALRVGQSVTYTVTYTMKDAANETSSADLVVTVNGANDDPTAVADSAPAATENGVQDFDVLANDTDPDTGDTKTIDSLGVVVFNANGTGLADPGNLFSIVAGQVQMNPGTALDALQAGQSVSFTVPYTMKDAANATSSASLVVTVTGTNDAPAITAPAITAPALSSFVVTNAMLNVTDADHTAAQVALTASGLTNVQFNVDTDNNGSFETNGATSFTLQQVNDGRVQMELLAGVQSGSILATDAAAATSNGGVATAITFNVAPAPAPDGGEPAAPFAASVQSDPVQEEAVAGSSQPILSFPARYDGVPSFEAVRETSLSSYHSFPSRESGSSANLFDGADLDFSGISSWQSGDGGQFQSQALVPLHSQNVFAIGAVAQPSGFDLGENATLGSFAQFSRTEPNWLSKLSPDFEDWQTSLPPLDELLVVAPPVVQYPVPGPPAPAPATMGPAPASAEAAPEAEGGEAVATADTASVAEPASEVPVTPSADDVPVDTPPAAMV